MLKFTTGIIALLLCTTACHNGSHPAQRVMPIDSMSLEIETAAIETAPEEKPALSRTARYMDSLGLVNIAHADSTILVQLIYATPDNFTGEQLYGDLSEAYLHPDAAQAVTKAQRILKTLHPSYKLIIYDAARPMSVQQKMWNVVKGTPKYIYVSNPAHGGGLHNYGLAVDIGIADSLNIPLPMGTEVDFMGAASHITNEAQLVKDKKITRQERENRLLLRKVMKEAGFRPLPSEWWHFNLCSRSEAMAGYSLIK